MKSHSWCAMVIVLMVFDQTVREQCNKMNTIWKSRDPNLNGGSATAKLSDCEK